MHDDGDDDGDGDDDDDNEDDNDALNNDDSSTVSPVASDDPRRLTMTAGHHTR